MTVEEARATAQRWVDEAASANIVYEANPTAAKLAGAGAIILDLCAQIDALAAPPVVETPDDTK